MKKYIPNTLTSLNLFSGCVGVIFCFKGNYDLVFYCFIFSGIFDFLDGTVARLLKVKSMIGKELDSLADVISFGFLPGVLMYSLMQDISANEYWSYFGFMITIFSALRLAKFNIDERQTQDFVGLNTPMNTFLIVSLPYIKLKYSGLFENVYLLCFIVIVSSLLLVSNFRLFSMKLSSLSWRENKYKFVFLAVSIVLVIVLKFTAVPLVFLAYFLFSYLHFANAQSVANDT